MRLAVVGIIAGGTGLSGCAQLAGIDETTGADPSVTLQFQRQSIGATVATAPADLSAGSAAFLVDSDTDPSGFERVPADLAAGDPSTWTAKIADGEPQVLFALPDHDPGLYDLGRGVKSTLVAFEHAGATPGNPDDTVDSALTIPPWNGTDTFQLYIVGTWGRHAIAPGALAAGGTALADAFPYGSLAPVTGAASLAAVTDADAVLALEYAGGKLVGAYDQSGFAAAGAKVAGTIAAATADQMLAVPIDPAGIAARLGAAMPVGGTPSTSWNVTAAPGAQVGQALGPVLDSGTVADADTMVAATYANPFAATRMWPAVMAVTATASRTYDFSPAGAAAPIPVPLIHQLTEVSPGSAGDAALGAPLASDITLAGVALAADGATVAIDATKPVAVTFTAAGGTLYQAVLEELVPNAELTAATFQKVLVAVSRTPAFRLPPEKLVAGHTYALTIATVVGGFPTVAVGDLQERTLPMATGLVTAGVFQVAP